MDQERTYKWVQDRLHDLHSGTISEADRIHLEEMAKTDPFIADAIEGYKAHTDRDHSLALKVIAQRIHNKNAERRPKLLPLSRGLVLQAVAASFVLILATWAVIYYVQKQNDATLVAAEPADTSSIEHSTEVELTYPDSSNGEIAGVTGTSDELNDEPSGLRANAQARAKSEEQRAEGEDSKAKALSKNDLSKKDELTLSEPLISAPASVPPTTYEDNTIIEEQSTREKETEKLAAGSIPDKSVAKKDEGYYANQMNPAIMAKRVMGRVQEFHSGDIVIGAWISIPNTNIMTLTDLDGRFELDLPEPSCIIHVKYTGLIETYVIASQGEENMAIQLHASEPMSPAFILPLDNSKSQQSITDSIQFAQRYLDYLKTNSRYPIQKDYDPKAKEVTLQFTLSSDGHPENIFSIKSTTDQKYMVEAYRLIIEGPSWTCDVPQYCMKKYTIYFK